MARKSPSLARLGWTDLVLRLEAEAAEPTIAPDTADAGTAEWAELSRRIHSIAENVGRGETFRGQIEFEPADIAQEVILRLQSRAVFHAVARSDNPEAYVTRTITNAFRDRIRRSTVQRRAVDGYREEIAVAGQTTSNPDQGATSDFRDDQLSAIYQVLNDLSIEERRLVEWRFHDGRPIGWIARQLGISYSAAGGRVFRLIRRIRGAVGTP